MDSLINDVVQDVQQGLGIREKLINNKKFSLTLLPADEGMAIFVKLVTMFGPSAASIADAVRTEDSTFPEDDDLITQAVLHLVSRMSDISDVLKLIKTIVREIKVEGKVIEFNEYFKGNYGELALALEWSLRENFQDAFTVWLKAKGLEIPTLSHLMKRQETTPETLSEE